VPVEDAGQIFAPAISAFPPSMAVKKRMHGCNGRDRDSIFAYRDVGKGREQDAEALPYSERRLTSYAGVTGRQRPR